MDASTDGRVTEDGAEFPPLLTSPSAVTPAAAPPPNVTVPIPPDRADVDTDRVHAWLVGKGYAVSAVGTHYLEDGRRELVIVTDADLAGAFADWTQVPRSPVQDALAEHRQATAAVLTDTAALPTVKRWIRSTNRLLRVAGLSVKD